MIDLRNISKQYGSKVLFEGASARIGDRSRLALVGPNGSGKSTLIKVILGQEGVDGGTVSRAKNLVIGHLAQEVPKIAGRTVLEECMRLDGRRELLLESRRELEEAFAAGSTEELERYGRVMEELELLDEYRLESRAKAILMGMGFAPKDFSRSLGEFSGGWLMRVALSRVLLLEPELLLLDEPTNHLDLESLLWLEEFLRAYRGALLLVSHDTAFLNRVVDEVLEIDQRRLWTYQGNLEDYARQKAERLAVLKSQYEGQQARIAEIERFVERFGAKATKARQAQSRLKELDRMERIEMPDDRATVRFRFPPTPHSGKEVITLKRAALSYGAKKVFTDLNWIIPRGARMAIVGVNGAGKTSLLKLLAGALPVTSGELRHGHEVKVGYYAQHQAESLRMDKTILQELEATAPHLMLSQVRAIAGAFLFTGDAVEKKCGVLSGGEKARVALAKLLLSPANFLVLDEPTNHLDVESRGVLLEALQDFEGTLVLVSHDRNFVSPLVDSVLEIEPGAEGSTVTPLLSGYEDYLARKIREAALRREPILETGSGKAGRAVEAAEPIKKAPSNNQKRSWERERDQLEADIAKAEVRQSEVAHLLSDPAVYADRPRAMSLIEEQRSLEKVLGDKMARWEEVLGLLS